MKVRLEAARLLTYRAAWRLEQTRTVAHGRLDRQAVRQRVAGRAALDAVQIKGGYGFMVEYEVERALRDAIGEHDLLRHLRDAAQIIARWLGL